MLFNKSTSEKTIKFSRIFQEISFFLQLEQFFLKLECLYDSLEPLFYKGEKNQKRKKEENIEDLLPPKSNLIS